MVEKGKKSVLQNCLDLLFIIVSKNGLFTKLYEKCDGFNFHIVSFPFFSSNIPSSPSYSFCISQLTGYRHKLFVGRLLFQGYEIKGLKNSLKKFYDSYPDVIKKYQRLVNNTTNDSFRGYFHGVI